MEPLNRHTVKTYLIQKEIFPRDAELTVIDLHDEIDDIEGYVNLIYQISDSNSNHSVVVKQLLPYIRAAREIGEDHPVLMARLRTEIAVLSFMGTLYEDITPKLYLFDEQAGVIVMEDLMALELLRFELTKGKTFPNIGKSLGTFLALLYFHTSNLFMTNHHFKGIKRFFFNDESKRLCDLLFIENALISTSKPLEDSAKETQARTASNVDLIKIINQLKYKYLNDNECLIHNDFHSANIMVNSEKIKIIDAEFSGYGSKFCDIGRLTGSMMINYISWLGVSEINFEKRKEMQEHDLTIIADLYNSYRLTLKKLWDANKEHSYSLKTLSDTEVYNSLLHDALQYGALSLITRITSDFAQTCDIKRIKDKSTLGLIQKRSLEMAEYTLLMTDTFHNIEEFNAFLRCCASVENN